MAIKLYNTLTKRIEPVKPLDPPAVTIYTCGPTVYDFPHVGNWFTFIRYDLLVRTLRAQGFAPTWVMNITDVGHLVSDADEGEDRLEKGARREHKSAWDVAAYYSEYFIDGLARLNITPPDYLPKATEHIDEQIALIRALEVKGYTYRTSDGVYFDTAKFPSYAAFAQLDLDEQIAGKRVSYDPEKRQPSDFALWKFSPPDRQRDMEWDSPWGRGFPGWHIECSAMSMKYLGPTLDIHAGGIDHLPVHHTNEIAQSEAATGQLFARHWMHSNHITIEGEKISKSLGNGITLEQIEAHGISLPAFRLHVLESHYRSQSKFSWLSLEAAHARLTRWQQMADQRWQVVQPDEFLSRLPASEKEFDEVEAHHAATKFGKQVLEDFAAAMANDLDTPRALAAIDRFMNAVEQNGMLSFYLPSFTKLLQHIDRVLGISLFRDDLPGAYMQLILEREQARSAKDWAAADRLRDQLAAAGVAIKDTPRGTVWHYAPQTLN